MTEQTILLRDAVAKLSDGSHNPPPRRDNGRPMLSARNIGLGSIDPKEARYIAPEDFEVERKRSDVTPGDVLLTIVGTIGRSAVVPEGHEPFVLQRSVALLRPKPTLDPKFLMYQLQAPATQHWMVKHARGVAQLGLYLKTLQGLQLWMPSLDEQHRIVTEIEEQLSRLESGVAALKRVQANLKRYRASVLAAACAGRLVPTEAAVARTESRSYETGNQLLARILRGRRNHWTGKGTYKEPAAPDTTGLPDLPEGWAWTNIEQLGDVIGGLTKNPKRELLPLKLPYLRVANVYADELRLDDIEHIGVNEAELEKLRLSVDDLLVVEGNGSLAQIGRVARWDGSIDPCVHQNHLIKVRLAGVNARWVMQWLLSMPGRAHIEAVAASTSGLHTLSTGKVARLPVPLPPFPEQHCIVAEVDRRLSLFREIEQQIEVDVARADRLRQSTLQRAFSLEAIR